MATFVDRYPALQMANASEIYVGLLRLISSRRWCGQWPPPPDDCDVWPAGVFQRTSVAAESRDIVGAVLLDNDAAVYHWTSSTVGQLAISGAYKWDKTEIKRALRICICFAGEKVMQMEQT